MKMLTAFIATITMAGLMGLIACGTPTNPAWSSLSVNDTEVVKGTDCVQIRVDGMTDSNASITENLSSTTGVGKVNISVGPRTGSGYYLVNKSMTWDATDSRWEYDYSPDSDNATDWYRIALCSINENSETDTDVYVELFAVVASDDEPEKSGGDQGKVNAVNLRPRRPSQTGSTTSGGTGQAASGIAAVGAAGGSLWVLNKYRK